MRGASGRALRVALPTAAHTSALGALLGTVLRRAPALVLLRGPLGSGKTCLARGFVRQQAADPELRVASPTFLIENDYGLTGAGKQRLFHLDLYRVQPGTESLSAVGGLSSVDVLAGISLVEWPDRVRHWPLLNRVDVTLRDAVAASPAQESEGPDEGDIARVAELQFFPFEPVEDRAASSPRVGDQAFSDFCEQWGLSVLR